MKIIHTSDLHINSPLNTRLSPDKVRKRQREIIETLGRMAEEAERLGAELFIIAGDLFDSERISASSRERVLGIIESHKGIDFLYLPGNHERNSLSECGLLLPENLKIFDTGWTYFKYGELTVSGRQGLSADMFDTLRTDGGVNICVLHGALGQHSSPDTVGIKDAACRGIDYIALGHYHSYSVTRVDKNCIAVYSGTPEGRGFDEAGECGFVLIDTDGGEVRHRFIPFCMRAVRSVSVDITGVGRRLDLENGISKELSGISSQDLVRVTLTGSRDPRLFYDVNSLAERWETAFFCFELCDKSKIAIDFEALKYDKSLKGEFIRLCLSKTDLSDEDRELIIRTGLSALSGEESGI